MFNSLKNVLLKNCRFNHDGKHFFVPLLPLLGFVFILGLSATGQAQAAVEIRVNVGGSAYTDGSNNVWSADTGFNTGNASSSSSPIAATTEDTLFQTNRWDRGAAPEMQYSFTVPNGDYTVNLLFADLYSGTFAVGARVFDVQIEGALALDNLDIFSEVGGNTALVKSTAVTVTDGQLNIEFLHGVENPMISAIEIIEAAPASDSTAPSIPTGVTASAVSDTQIGISWTASTDAGGGIVAGYKIFRDGGATAIATVTGTSYSDTGLTANTPYSYTVSAFDNAIPANESLLSSASSATTSGTPSFAIRVNTGGNAYTDGAGNLWSADTGFNTGRVSSSSTAISATTEDTLYQSNRWDLGTGAELQYSFTVPNGDYTVNLHYADLYSGTHAVGARVFDVFMEGALVSNNLDIFSEVGGNTALVKSTGVSVSDGQLNIEFIHGVENPMVSAIEIVAGAPASDTTAPSVPANVAASASSDTQVDISWTASTDTGGGTVAGYKIFRDGGATAIATVTGTSYSDTGLTANTAYSYTVSAFDTAIPANESVVSSSVSATTLATPAFALRVNVGGNAYTDGAGKLWSADTGFNTGFASSSSSPISGTTEDTLYQSNRWDHGAAPEMQYSFTVPNGNYTVKMHYADLYSGAFATGARVFDVLMEGALVSDNLDIFSEVGGNAALIKSAAVVVADGQLNIDFIHVVENPMVSAIEIIASGSDTTPPSVPANVSATAASDTQIDLSWTASTDTGGSVVAGYKIYRNGGATEIATVTGTSYSNTGLSANTTYNYTVSAFDTAIPANESVVSTVASATTLATDTQAPSVPAGVNASAISDTQIDISWTASTDSGGGTVAGYKIFRDGGTTAIATVTSTSYSDTGLTPSTNYSYTVSAFDTATPANESALSSSANATTSSAPAFALRVNAGGSAYTDGSGNIWSADTGSNTGNTAGSSSPISGTTEDTLYQSNRWDLGTAPELQYSFTVPNGNYTVNLHYADLYSGTFATGARVFDVQVEGVLVSNNLDVFSEVGGNAALVKGSYVTVADGQLNINFSHVVENPMISAIEIIGGLAPPVISPNGGNYLGNVNVVLSTVTTGAEIRYTLDGSDPVPTSTLYTGPFVLGTSATVKSRTYKGGEASQVSSAVFNVNSFPYVEDFSTGTDGWVFIDDYTNTSSWAVNTGELQQSSDYGISSVTRELDGTSHKGTYAYLFDGLSLSNYRVSADLTPIKQPGYSIYDDGHDIGLMFRYQNNDNYYRIALNSEYGYARLERKLAGVFSTLAVDARGYSSEGVTVNVAVELVGDLIHVYINGEPRFAVQDNTLPTGSVAIYTEDGARFDNIVINSNSSSPAIIINEPSAFTAQPGTAIAASAVAMNVPAGGSVEFDIDGTACSAASESSPGYYVSTCTVAVAGEHTVTANLKDNGSIVASDANIMVGSSAEVRIVVGDSISNGVTDTYTLDNQSADGKIIGEQGYVAVLQDLLSVSRAAPQMIYNEAVPGDESLDLDQRLFSILARHPEANIAQIQVGTNDSSGTLPLPSGTGCTGSACNGTYKKYVQNVIDTLTLADVTPIISMIPPAFTSNDPLNDARNQIIQEYNSVLANELSIPALGPDLFSYFLSANENRFSLYADDLHFNGLGYSIMARLWEHYINGGTSLPTRAQLPLVLEDICIRTVSASCQTPLTYKQDFMQTGNPYYIDAAFDVQSIPSALVGGIWLQTANADSANNRADYLTFTIDRNADVYVAYDSSATIPTWLTGFTDTGTNLNVSNSATPTLRLYKKTYIFGVDTALDGSITLGGNMASGASGANANYIMVVKEQ